MVEVAVHLEPIQREGIARGEMWERFRKVFPNPSVGLEVDSRRCGQAELDPLERRMVDLAEEGLTMESMTLELHATDFLVASRLLRLKDEGILRPTDAPSSGLNSPTHPESGDHLLAARSALSEGRLGEAMQFIRDGAQLDPGNQSYAALQHEIETQAALESGDVPLRGVVPRPHRMPESSKLMELNARERYIFGRVDGERTVQDILNISPMHDLEAMTILRKLENVGFIAL